ncbi:MAG: hypothetical protein U1F34_08040 [Gammaproteobacteria bacterium]
MISLLHYLRLATCSLHDDNKLLDALLGERICHRQLIAIANVFSLSGDGILT